MTEKKEGGFIDDMESSVRPYKETHRIHSSLPEKGLAREEIIQIMEDLKSREESRWEDGFVSGAVYSGDRDHIEFLNKVYEISSQTNPLHADIWPSITKYEAEIVSMTGKMLGADKVDEDMGDEVCGVVSSGGTESILLAMKTYRDWARDMKGIINPEMIIPSTVHAAFDKASQYFNIKQRRIPVGPDFKADVAATEKAITPNTIVIVGSAPSFPHGVIDPIEELSELALSEDIGFHSDACLGGFILPWAEKLGFEVPPFDFRLPGVTSISADTHKYGYAAKGSSVILYRSLELRRYQFYTTADWPGGLYFSPTFAGSRSGALSATAWAAMVSIGEEGYLERTKRILETADKIKKGIEEIPEIHVLGDPLWDIGFASDTLNIYQVLNCMSEKNWNLNGLQLPPAAHICLTLRHTQPGIAERFLEDLASSVEYVKNNPDAVSGELGSIYGMSATIPIKGIIGGVIKKFIDTLYKV